MEILLAICLLLALLTIGFLFFRLKKVDEEKRKLKEQAIFLSKIDLEFLEFAADMYVKYSEELKIHSKEQHEILLKESLFVWAEHVSVLTLPILLWEFRT